MSNRRTIIIWYNNGIYYIVWHFKESLTHKIREHRPFKEKHRMEVWKIDVHN